MLLSHRPWGVLRLPAALPRLQLPAEVPLRVPEHSCLLKVLLPDGLRQLPSRLDRPLLQLLQFLRQDPCGQPGPGGCLVHQIDGLVRQEALGQIADGQVHRCRQSPVGDGQMVVGLIPAPQPPEDSQCFLPGGFPDGDRLEPPLQGGVLLDIPPVFVQGGGPQHLDLPPGEGGFQDVGRIDGPLRRASPHDGMQLVDKEDDIPRPAHLLKHVLQLLLKLPPVLGARHHGRQIQGTHPLAQQMRRGRAVGNGQSQPLRHRCLAHAGLPDQCRVVLGAAGEDLDHPVQLLLPADHRIQPSLRRHPGQIPGTLVQLTGVAGGPLRLPAPDGTGDALLPAQRGVYRPAQALPVHLAGPQQPRPGAFRLQQHSKQQVLRSHRRTAKPPALLRRPADDLAAPGRQALAQGGTGRPGAYQLYHGRPQGAAVRPRLPQQPGRQAVLLAGQPQQKVLTAHIAVPQPDCVLLGQPDGPQGCGCKPAVRHLPSPP